MIFLIAVLVLIVLAFVFLCYRVYRFVFYTPTKTQNDDLAFPKNELTLPRYEEFVSDIRALNSRPYEDVYITSRDGLRLHARYFSAGENTPVAICFHGYRGTPARNFAGGPPCLLREGFSLLMPEARGHGASEGHTVTFGVKERYDGYDWVKYAADRFGEKTPILLVGLSMGAYTTLMASGMDLPSNVKGIMADSPYQDPQSILLHAAGNMHLPLGMTWFVLRAAALLFGHFRFEEADAVEAASHASIPIVLLHGEKDAVVPPSMSEAVQAANPALVRRETFPDAGHGMSYIVDTPRYERLVHEFTEQVIRG